MSVSDELTAIPSGARFYRVDLHIHSFGGSHDVRDGTMTPDGIVKTAIAEGLSAIAVTDHNEINNVAQTITAGDRGGLLVLPGVELSTPQGHLLVYFDTYELLDKYYGKLSLADRASQQSRCQTGLLDCLNLIDSAHGFAILAHVDADGGFEKSVLGFPPSKGDVIVHPSLLGFELKSAQSQIFYSDLDPEPQRIGLGKKRLTALALSAINNRWPVFSFLILIHWRHSAEMHKASVN